MLYNTVTKGHLVDMSCLSSPRPCISPVPLFLLLFTLIDLKFHIFLCSDIRMKNFSKFKWYKNFSCYKFCWYKEPILQILMV